MEQPNVLSERYADLRPQAEERLRRQSLQVPDIGSLAPDDIEGVIHELLVQIMERDLHIESMTEVGQDDKQSGLKCSGICEYAPAAYFAVDSEGLIRDANTEGALLMRAPRESLLDRPIARFVHKDDVEVYLSHLEKVFQSGSKQVCEVRLVRSDGDVFHARMRSAVAGELEDRAAVSAFIVTDITSHKESEQALRESQERYRELVNLSPDGIGVYDGRGDIVFVNDTLAKILGYSPSDLIGVSIVDLVYQDSKEVEIRRIRKMLEKKDVQPFMETLWVKADGTPIDVEVASVSVSFQGEPAVQMVVRDITERRQAQEDLRKSELRFRHVYESVPVMMHSIDIEGKIVSVNRKWLEITGYRRQEVVGRNVESVMTPESRVNLRSILPKFWRKGTVSAVPYQYTKKDGTLIDVLLDSVVMDDPEWGRVSLSAIRDVTAQKRAERALRESEARYRALFENMREGVAIFTPLRNGEDFVFLDYNRSAERIDGTKREDVIGKSVTTVFPGVKEFGLFDLFRRVLRTGKPESPGVRKYVDDKLEGWRDSFVYKLPSGEIVSVFSDETERKMAEEELRRRTRDLSERIKELNCLYGISKLVESEAASPEDMVASILDLVPEASHDPGATCARIVLEDREFKTDNFKETRWKLSSPVTVQGEPIGTLDVCSLKSDRESGKQPFLDEERKLIEAVAERIGRIVERNRAEKALRFSEERFRAIFESAEEYIFIKDRDLKHVLVNPAMERLLGRKAADVVGLRSENLFGREAGIHMEEVDRRVLDGESVEEERTIPVHGVPLTLHFTTVPLKDRGGRVMGICTMAREITERKRIAQEFQTHREDYQSASMQNALNKARVAAQTHSIVLLQGESGSGKDFLARWIHDHSPRAGGPFFTLNCAAVARSLAESELFGHERGSFTGAVARKKGILELAEGGTLLLNEIGELDLALQAKLLAFLDTRSFLRVGGQAHIHVNARLIAATHRNLDVECAEGRFLRPLLYRLSVFPIEVPSLRERKDDIPVLAEEIIQNLASEMQLSRVPVMDPEHVRILGQYHWPGNVRELRNVLERSLMLWRGGRFKLTLPVKTSDERDWSYTVQYVEGQTLREVTDEVTRSLCSEILHRCRGNKKETARLLGISRDALYRYMRRMDILSG
ncbi:MAG: PAS domain S-box protein [Desulfomonilaceae bacterium]|nr:PAS domain S-box protein [Desulfomonilaceae bacterium]